MTSTSLFGWRPHRASRDCGLDGMTTASFRSSIGTSLKERGRRCDGIDSRVAYIARPSTGHPGYLDGEATTRVLGDLRSGSAPSGLPIRARDSGSEAAFD